MSEPTVDLAVAFRARAREEAERYGGDPWVLVRELLQNARDAGARTVRVEVWSREGVEGLEVRDDGDGLDLDQARRFLFTLYASNKVGPDQAGRFGVGFWSVLRFRPERIVVRSWPRRGAPWELVFDGQLRTVGSGRPGAGPAGFEVVLERRARGEDLVGRVCAALRRDAPYLRRRGAPDAPLQVSVNGQPTATPFQLEAPSLVFHRRGLRGAVGLGPEPRVDLYVHGLRVRTAASLDDLVASGGARSRPEPGGSTGKGLAPRVLLDSDRLELLLARGDARDTRELRRVVEAARQELARLVRGQLDRWAPRPWPLRLLERLPRWATEARWRTAGLGLVAASVVVAVGVGVWAVRSAVGSKAAAATAAWVPYGDLAEVYRGPTVEGLAPGPAVDLTYRPPQASLLIAGLVLGGLEADGSPRLDATPVARYPWQPCVDGCVELEVGFAARSRWLRLPLPTGHRLEAAGVRVDGHAARVWTTATGEALLELDAPGTGRVRYRTGPGPVPVLPRGGWPPLPPPLAAEVARLRHLTEAERVKAALALVRSRVAYDTSPTTAARHREATRLGLGFIQRALVVGAGDCDVQNALLAAVLDQAGLGARLAVGFVGTEGHAAAGLHAWVEVAVEGRLRAADASVSTGGPGGATARVGPSGDAAARLAPGAATTGGARSRLNGDRAAAWWPRGLAAAVTLVVAAWVATLGWRRGQRRLRLAGGDGLAELLRGALERPEAFARVGEIHGRPLVPVVGGGRVSLARARRVEGRALYRGRSGVDLTEAAARRGMVVLDVDTPEGREVADALGAVDLDWWQRLLGRSEASRLAGEGAVRLGARRVEVRLADGVGEPMRSLEIPGLGVDLVVLERSSGLGRRLVELAPRRPALAALLLADAVARHCEVPASRRGPLLGGLAAAALREQVGG